MSAGMASVVIPEEMMTRRVEKYLLKQDDVVWAFGGSVALVQDLRTKGLLSGRRYGKTLFFSSVHVGEVAAAWLAGEYDELLEA